MGAQHAHTDTHIPTHFIHAHAHTCTTPTPTHAQARAQKPRAFSPLPSRPARVRPGQGPRRPGVGVLHPVQGRGAGRHGRRRPALRPAPPLPVPHAERPHRLAQRGAARRHVCAPAHPLGAQQPAWANFVAKLTLMPANELGTGGGMSRYLQCIQISCNFVAELVVKRPLIPGPTKQSNVCCATPQASYGACAQSFKFTPPTSPNYRILLVLIGNLASPKACQKWALWERSKKQPPTPHS